MAMVDVVGSRLALLYKPLFRHMAAQTDKQTKEMHRKTK